MEIHYTYPEVTLLLPSVLNVGFLWKIRDIMKQSVYAKMSIYLIVMTIRSTLGVWMQYSNVKLYMVANIILDNGTSMVHKYELHVKCSCLQV